MLGKAKHLTSLFCLVLAPTSAQAASVWLTLINAGLTGTWAVSCKSPMGHRNPFFTFYGDLQGDAGFLFERGSNFRSAHATIAKAKRLSPTSLRILMRYDDPAWGSQKGQSFDVLVELIDRDHLRTVSSIRLKDGRELIRDAKVLADSRPSDIEERCPKHPRT